MSPRRGAAASVLAVLLAASGGCSHAAAPDTPAPAQTGGYRLERIADGLDQPVHVTALPGDPRLFVCEQPGVVRIVRDGRVLATPFLDLRDRVASGGERGLLSLAFHPSYAQNGFFFVNYTNTQGDTRVVRYHVSADPDRADPASAKTILGIEQPYENHNGGLCLFGPDGMLWIGMGDGGSGGDPHGNGQKRTTLLGKMLRIDVDHGDPYAIPAGNPYVGQTGARPEIWAIGMRNPWRFSFDRAEHLLYVADVGQNRWEEIDAVRDDAAGLNFGWNIMESLHCYKTSRCDRTGLVLPVAEYSHGSGCSVTGGMVYRGHAIPALVGHYVYADYCTGWIRSFRLVNGAVTEHVEWRLDVHPQVTSFGEDGAGELLVVGHEGRIYRVVADG